MTSPIRLGFLGGAVDPELELLRSLGPRLEVIVIADGAAATAAGRNGIMDVLLTTDVLDIGTLAALEDSVGVVLMGSLAPDDDVVALPRHPLSAPILELAIRAARDRWQARSRARERLLSDDVFESLPVGVAVTGLDDRIIDVNPQASALVGADRDELRGGAAASLVPSRGTTILKLVKSAAAGQPTIVRKTKRLVQRDGTTATAEVSASLLYDESGHPVGCVRTLVDVTRRKAAEERLLVDVDDLRRAEDEVRAAHDALVSVLTRLPAGVILVESPSGKPILANEAAHSLLGEAAGLGAAALADAVPFTREDGKASGAHPLLEVLGDGRPHGSDDVWVEREGRRLALSVRAAPIPYRSRAAAIFVVQDVSDLRAQHAKQKALESELTSLQKLEAVGLLAGGVAHEFNNLLSGVMGFQQLALKQLEEEPGPTDQPRRYLERAQQSSAKAAELATRLLGVTRGADVPLERMDLGAAIDRAASAIRPLLGEGVELTLRGTPGSLPIRGIPAEVEQLLVQLALNARDAMPGGGSFAIEARRESGESPRGIGALEGSLVALVVSDTGVGMTEDVRSHLFEPFFTTKERGRGTGLGLATVRGIVRRHGGRILVNSSPGRGTRVTILIPELEATAEAPPARVPTAPLASPPGPHAPAGANESILVVDDDPIVLDATATMLEVLGYRVTTARGAQEALEAFSPGIDAVVTDIVMPGKSGLELSRELLARDPQVKILLVSGYSGEAFSKETQDESLLRQLPVLKKPVTLGVLAARLRESLDLRHNR